MSVAASEEEEGGEGEGEGEGEGRGESGVGDVEEVAASGADGAEVREWESLPLHGLVSVGAVWQRRRAQECAQPLQDDQAGPPVQARDSYR